MNHSEYLRRKMEAAPRILGPARPGDASETTRMRGAIAAAGGRRRAAPRRFAAWRPGAELVRLVASQAFPLDAGRSAGDNQLALPFAAGIGYRDPQRRSRLGQRSPI